MNHDDTLALFDRGRDAWNEWAVEQLAQKVRLEESNTDLTVWASSARADFKDHAFNEDVNLEQFVFPGVADFENCSFRGMAAFSNAEFHSAVWFVDTHFERGAFFTRAQFFGDANFLQTRFEGFTTFWDCYFQKAADFSAIDAKSIFDITDTKFCQTPDFFQAHFNEAPRLDNMKVPIEGFWRSLRNPGNPDVAACYRALKRLAIQGHDHDREQIFFTGELRSLRGNPDKPWPNLRNLFRKNEDGVRRKVWPGGARYWFGLFYDVSQTSGGPSCDLFSGGELQLSFLQVPILADIPS